MILLTRTFNYLKHVMKNNPNLPIQKGAKNRFHAVPDTLIF